jgi:hypothetical protein
MDRQPSSHLLITTTIQSLDQGTAFVLPAHFLSPDRLLSHDAFARTHVKTLAEWHCWRQERGLPDLPPNWWMAVNIR